MNNDLGPLADTLARLARASTDAEGRFEQELVADLTRRHPHVLAGRVPSAGTILAALRLFATAPPPLELEQPEWGEDRQDVAVIDLADSVMKSFARVLGRAQWTPALALAWNEELQERGGELVAKMRSS